MAIQRNQTKDKIYKFLTGTLSMTHEGACGFMANLQAESGCRFDMMEGLLAQRYSEDGNILYSRPVNVEPNITLNNSKYTQLIDRGVIALAEFLNPRKKHYGYGLCQWTTEARKKLLWSNTIGNGKSIADADGQLLTLQQDLESTYKTTLNYCRNAKSAADAAEYVLRHFEQPKITAAIVSARRKYAEEFAELYKEDKMSVIIGSARIGENGHATGGSAGDQTGSEVSTQAFYMHSKGWYRLRPKSVSVANSLAKEMQDGCNNNNIGYNQNSRDQVVSAVKTYKHLASITKKVNSDCSSLVRACIYAATGKDVGDFYTGNEASALEQSGLFEKRASVSSAADVKNGDVLVTKSKGHTVIVTSGAPRSAATSSGSAVTSTWKAVGTATVVNTNRLNVRSGAGTSNAVITTLGKGNRFEVDGKTSGKWIHIKTGSTIGWVHSDYVAYDSGNTNTKTVSTVLNVRKHAGKTATKCATFGPLNTGDKVSVQKTTTASDGSTWALVTYVSGSNPNWIGKAGWCAAKYLK